jgi:isopenicillin-N N-acyltransferase-like protein
MGMATAYSAEVKAAGGTRDGALRFARKVGPLVEEFHPDFVEEIRGYADSTGSTIDDIVAQWSGYPTLPFSRGCTDLATGPEVTADGSVYAAHNEDYMADYFDLIVPVYVSPKGKPSFFAMSYGGLFPTCGFNVRGISITGNGLSPNDCRLGIPKMFPPRKVLEASDLVDALEWAMPAKRGDSFNNIVCSAEGEIYSLEGSATRFFPIHGEEGWLVHTNHYLAPEMEPFESDLHDSFSSIVRYHRARRLLRRCLGKVDLDAFRVIFRDHVGHPRSICRHTDPDGDPPIRVRTNFSSVLDLTHLKAYVCRGNPCEGDYQVFQAG